MSQERWQIENAALHLRTFLAESSVRNPAQRERVNGLLKDLEFIEAKAIELLEEKAIRQESDER